MGAWDVGPTDNDTAADLADDLQTKTIYEVIADGLASTDVDEQRVAAWLITRLGDPLIHNGGMQSHVTVALDHMKALLADEDWISEWDNVAAIRKAVQKQIDDLSSLGAENSPLCPCCDEKLRIPDCECGYKNDPDYCKECRVPEHDVCSMTAGCPCCEDTKQSDEDS